MTNSGVWSTELSQVLVLADRLGWRSLQKHNQVAALEGDVFVGDFRAAGGGESVVGGAGLVEIFTARGTAGSGRTCAGRHAFAASAKHAEIAGDDFEAGALLALLVLPLAGLDAALNENKRALFQILLSDFSLFAPDDNLVPLGALLAFAVAVFIGLVGGDGEIGDGLSAGGVASFGVAAKTADEDDFVDGHSVSSSERRKITRWWRKMK
jgi:hypothetical protein